jgi:hypothetical protein
VIGAPGNPGLLSAILPWWDEFLQQSTDYLLPAGKLLRAFREDLLQYMLEWYASLGPGGHG